MGVKYRSYQTTGGGGGLIIPLAITTTSPLPNPFLNAAYTGILAATGGTPPYTWTIIAGALPTGMTLTAATGALTGTPTVQGVFSATFRVTDAVLATADLVAAITVLPTTATLSDDFNRANGAIGPLWGYVRANNAASPTINANRLVLTGISGVFDNQQYMMAELMAGQPLFGFRQYCTMQLISTTATGIGASLANAGPTVFNSGGLFPSTTGVFLNCYQALISPDPVNLHFEPVCWNAGIIRGAGAGFQALALGDVLGIRAQVLNAATVRVELLRNGAVVQTWDDANALRIQTGIPGFAIQAINVLNVIYDNYESGTF